MRKPFTDVNNKPGQSVFLLMLCLMLLSAMPASAKPEPESLWTISTKNLVLKPGERISSFSLNLKAATIKSIPRVPSMWRILVYNFQHKYPPWSTTVEAQAGAGVAFLEPEYFNRDFVCIRKGAADTPFDVQLKVVAAEDSKTDRVLVIPMERLAIKPMQKDRLWRD
ncbi:MAG TPA: hypothetical protein PL012_20375 [Candidatus Obscuribacter sp.]|nr:hypothetical protein [Candidatus Obscuribacter sp.]